MGMRIEETATGLAVYLDGHMVERDGTEADGAFTVSRFGMGGARLAHRELTTDETAAAREAISGFNPETDAGRNDKTRFLR